MHHEGADTAVTVDPGETKDLSAERADLKEEMLRDYAAYEREMGVLPLPPGYDPHKQVAKNSMKRQFKAFGWRIALVGAVLLTLAVLGVRRLRRGRRTA